MKRFLIFILATSMCLFVGCSSNADTDTPTDATSETSAIITTSAKLTDAEILQKLQAKNNVPAEYSTVTIEECGNLSEYAIDNNLSTISQYSSNIVKATVKSVEYFTNQNSAWSRFELSIALVYRGDTKVNDTITLVTNSGYINAKDKYGDTEAKDGTEIDLDALENIVYYEYSLENQPPVVGNTYLFFLTKQDRQPFNGDYGNTRGDASRLLFVEENGIFVMGNSFSKESDLIKYSEDDIIKIINENLCIL